MLQMGFSIQGEVSSGAPFAMEWDEWGQMQAWVPGVWGWEGQLG